MRCPDCGLFCPPTSVWCDCGHVFRDRVQELEQLKRGIPVIHGAWAFVVFSLVVSAWTALEHVDPTFNWREQAVLVLVAAAVVAGIWLYTSRPEWRSRIHAALGVVVLAGAGFCVSRSVLEHRHRLDEPCRYESRGALSSRFPELERLAQRQQGQLGSLLNQGIRLAAESEIALNEGEMDRFNAITRQHMELFNEIETVVARHGDEFEAACEALVLAEEQG